jgi:tetratricopeptide (TPR) repeat protein
MSAREREPARPAAAPLSPKAWRLAVALVLAVVGLYARTATHDFVSYDDGSYLLENPHVAGGLTAANVRWAFLEFHSANWHPLTWLSHQLDVTLFGLERAGPHHLTSAALHALNAVLCLFFFVRATGKPWASFLVALFFAVHPLRVESVAWVSERKDVLAGTFFFLTLLAYERYARAPGRGRALLVALALTLGLLAKPMLVSVPPLLLLLDGWPLQRWARGLTPARALLEKLPLFALAAASAVVTVLAQRSGAAVQSIEVLTLAERAATAVHGVIFYLAKSFAPVGLCFFYPHPAFVGARAFEPLSVPVLAGFTLIVGVSVATWHLRARLPMLAVGWCWTLGMLVPVVGLVQVGAQFYADRYAYLPLVGTTAGLVFAGQALARTQELARALAVFALALAGLFAALAARQVATWRDSQTMCARALAVTRENPWAEEHMGLFLQRRGELAAAAAHYRAALASAPQLPSSHVNLGAIHLAEGRRAEARAEFEEALRLSPGFLNARLSLGLWFESEGEAENARREYGRATELAPEASEAWRRLGDMELALGRAAQAQAAFRNALLLEGASSEARAGFGEAALELGQLEEAARALGALPRSARERHVRIRVHLAAGEVERARGLLAGCTELGEPRDWEHARSEAAFLAALGRAGEAAQAAAEALALAPRLQWERLSREHAAYAARREERGQ